MTTTTSHAAPDVRAKNNKLVLKLVIVAVIMGSAGFTALPWFKMWCDTYFGNGDAIDQKGVLAADAEAHGRPIKVYFEARALDGLPVLFFPEERIQTARPGEKVRNVYKFKNTSSEPVHFRPIHDVAPLMAAQMYKMEICFCFNDQVIPAYGTNEYEVVYYFEPDIDPRIGMCTVRYDLHKISEDDMRPMKKGFGDTDMQSKTKESSSSAKEVSSHE